MCKSGPSDSHPNHSQMGEAETAIMHAHAHRHGTHSGVFAHVYIHGNGHTLRHMHTLTGACTHTHGHLHTCTGHAALEYTLLHHTGSEREWESHGAPLAGSTCRCHARTP